MDELRGMGIIAGSILAVIVVLEASWRRIGKPRRLSPEPWRKAHHIGIGLVASFSHEWIRHGESGMALALTFGAVLAFAYRNDLLESLFGERHGTATLAYREFRHSWIGPVTYSLAVALVSLFFWHRPQIYRASLLILALGDSAASVCGMLLGTAGYEIFGTRRTLEGNLALFSFSSLVCGFLMTDGSLTAIGAALLLGLLLSLTETISPFGLDNLTLPLMTGSVMLSIWDPELAGFVVTPELVMALGLVVAAALLLTLSQLDPGALEAAALVMGAAAVTLLEMGRWLFVAILVMFFGCTLLARALAGREGRAGPGGFEILSRVTPCLLFVIAGMVVGTEVLAIGSLACVVLLSRNLWCELQRPPDPAGSAGSGSGPGPGSVPGSRGLGLDAAACCALTWAAVFTGGIVSFLSDLGPLGSSILTVGLAAAAGGLLCSMLPVPSGRRGTGGAWLQVVPAVVALSAAPVMTRVFVRLVAW